MTDLPSDTASLPATPPGESAMPLLNWMCSEEFYAQLDPGIRFAVRLLHAHGVETGQSCEGGEGHAYDHPSIDLNGQPDDGNGFAALAVLNAYRLPVRSVEYVWGVCRGIPTPEAHWRVTFRRPMADRADDHPMFIHHYRYNEVRIG